MEQQSRASRGAVWTALLTVYVVWGSTYLAIRFAIETLPPLLMAGVRFLVAGVLMYAMVRRRTGPGTPLQWRRAALIGFLLLVCGNGGVVWAEQWVESGTAALVIATVPLWFVLLDWLRPGGSAPRPLVWAGVALGVAGVFVLLGGGGPVEPGFVQGGAILLFAALAWSVGSLYSRYTPQAEPLLLTAMQMIVGGVLLLLLGTGIGETTRIDVASFSTRSLAALAYLVVFGSLIGYTAYVWLLRATTPALVSTYAFVNPVVAVFLGWLLAGEALTGRMVVATLVIVSAVALITVGRTRGDAARETSRRERTVRRVHT